MYQYERDGAAIYRQSFATIRAEADLAGLPAEPDRRWIDGWLHRSYTACWAQLPDGLPDGAT